MTDHKPGQKRYSHKRVYHAQHVYVTGDVHTNTVDGFWPPSKRGVSGAYHGVSTAHLQEYVDEYVFRYNNRGATGRGMFEAFLSRAASTARALRSSRPSPSRQRIRPARGPE